LTRETRFVVGVFYEHYSCFQLIMRYKRETQLCSLGNVIDTSNMDLLSN